MHCRKKIDHFFCNEDDVNASDYFFMNDCVVFCAKSDTVE